MFTASAHEFIGLHETDVNQIGTVWLRCGGHGSFKEVLCDRVMTVLEND